jgi:RND superfamily putative drug exporter
VGALSRWCAGHARLVLGCWLAVLVGTLTVSLALGSRYENQFSLPGTQSQRAIDVMRAAFPGTRGDPDQVVFQVRRGTVFDPAVRNRMEKVFAELRRQRYVRTVYDPYRTRTQTGVSRDRRTAYATVRFDMYAFALPAAAASDLVHTASTADDGNLHVAVSGQAIENLTQRPSTLPEAIGLLVAVFVLMLTFRSAVAMGMALGSALCAIGTGFGVMSLVTHVMAIPNFTPELAVMIGLGVGIDYGLFVLTRFRTATDAGESVSEATATAMTTSGRAVVFAGVTVVVALLGMYVVGIPFVDGMAVGAALMVALTMIAAITVLPALLGIAGRHIDDVQLPLPGRRRRLAGRSGAWERWARFIQRRPREAMAASLGLIVLLALPVVGLRLGEQIGATDNPSATTHQAYAMLSRAFGPGATDPFDVVVEQPHPGGSLTALLARLRATSDVAVVEPPVFDRAGTVALIEVLPKSGPVSPATTALLNRLRTSVQPSVDRNGRTMLVGGLTAVIADEGSVMGHSIPVFVAGVVGASFILLLLLFRSLVVPVKAGLMNLLSIAAAFGVVTAVFQWGWGASAIGVDRTGPIDVYLPLMLFAIVFGLSMDYEVFLLSRIREEWLRSGDNSRAVAIGLATTGRVITAAAAIMIVVFASFVFGGQRTIKLFGLGLATAVLLDAVVIRSVLVPATMELLGRVNWWLPRWLSGVLPRIALGRPEVGPAPATD